MPGQLWATDDGGQSCTVLSPPGETQVQAAGLCSGGMIWMLAATFGGGLWIRPPGDAGWREIATGSDRTVEAASCAGSGRLVFLRTVNGDAVSLVAYAGSGPVRQVRQWQPGQICSGYRQLAFASATDGILLCQGSLLETVDGGRVWTTHAVTGLSGRFLFLQLVDQRHGMLLTDAGSTAADRRRRPRLVPGLPRRLMPGGRRAGASDALSPFPPRRGPRCGKLWAAEG